MNRVEKFKEARKFRIKCISIFVFSFLMAITGVCISDYSVNALMKNQKTIQLVEVKSIDKTKVHVSILNLGVDMDTSHFMKDFKGIREKFRGIFGF
jgi:hypothetical protein